MKKQYKLLGLALLGGALFNLVSCDKNEEPGNNQEQPGNKPGEDDNNEGTDKDLVKIGFSNVDNYLIGGPTSYGANLYYGAEGQITEGYMAYLDGETYLQFPVNYAEQIWTENSDWQYTFYNGGVAVSRWHDMEGDTFENQLSVYNPISPSGGNFVVTFGNAQIENPMNATLGDYDECGRIYVTDKKGYGVSFPGEKTFVSGNEKKAFFKSVQVANNTYPYLIMKNGNDFASALNSDNKGWYKVQFIAFGSGSRTAKPVGVVEAYLANFNEALSEAAGYSGEIKKDWIEVDLSSLPETSVLVFNLMGSDIGQFGLNTPCYCSLDNFILKVGKD